MNGILELQTIRFRMALGESDWRDCVNWAMERLRNDEEEGDLDLVMLAAATREDETRLLVDRIAYRYLGEAAWSHEFAAGKRIVELYRAYKNGTENAVSIEPKLWYLYYHILDKADWLEMLARNCEYATDTESFQKPFDDEFSYIAGLWEASDALQDFLSKYDRNVSRSHDAI